VRSPMQVTSPDLAPVQSFGRPVTEHRESMVTGSMLVSLWPFGAVASGAVALAVLLHAVARRGRLKRERVPTVDMDEHDLDIMFDDEVEDADVADEADSYGRQDVMRI